MSRNIPKQEEKSKLSLFPQLRGRGVNMLMHIFFQIFSLSNNHLSIHFYIKEVRMDSLQ